MPEDLMPAPSWRYVTAAETRLAAEVFGPAFPTARVRMFCLPFVSAPFTPGSWGVVWPHGWGHACFASAPLRRQGDFIHELAHVWQARQGVNLALAKLHARSDYDYRPLGPERFGQMNIEQQAAFIEHAFLSNRGWRGGPPVDYYARVAAIWRSDGAPTG